MNFPHRLYSHKWLLKKGGHHSVKLQRHVVKYGLDDILIVFIEDVLPHLLAEREQFYMDLLNPYFNVNKKAKIEVNNPKRPASVGGKSREIMLSLWANPEFREKQLERLSQPRPYRKGIPSPMKGKSHSEEWSRNISNSLKGRKGRPMLYEERERRRLDWMGNKNPNFGKKYTTTELDGISKKLKEYFLTPIGQATIKRVAQGNQKNILQYDKNMGFIKEWDSATSVQLSIGISQSNISQCARGCRLSAGGFIWRFKDSE